MFHAGHDDWLLLLSIWFFVRDSPKVLLPLSAVAVMHPAQSIFLNSLTHLAIIVGLIPT